MAATLSYQHGHHLNTMSQDFGAIHLMPEFVFPPRSDGEQTVNTRRSASTHLAPSPCRNRSHGMRQSASALPTFSFNASDTSGFDGATPEPSPSSLSVQPSPAKSNGHRRGASELVGGDSRLAFGKVPVLSPPSKPTDNLPLPESNGSPARGRGHAHRRSTAISGHDLNSILQPRDANVPLSLPSAPQTPTIPAFSPIPSPIRPVIESRASSSSLAASGDEDDTATTTVRPTSRPRVGFSENIEYIPRPLSTISSDTASSVATVRGHRLTNSMSSVMTIGGVGSPSPRRTRFQTPDNALEIMTRATEPSEAVVNNQLSHEQQRSLSSYAVSGGILPAMAIKEAEDLQASSKKHFFKLDRRRSEPLISLTASAEIGTSTISLQEPLEPEDAHSSLDLSEQSMQNLSRGSSRKKVKKWASSILGRKSKDSKKSKASPGSEDESVAETGQSYGEPTGMDSEEEPDLEALFGQDPFVDEDHAGTPSVVSPQLEIDDPFRPFTMPAASASEDASPVIDLDAALGPYGTPSMSWDAFRPVSKRRQLHSSRLTKDFVGPGMHYHRRTESAPALVPFEFAARTNSPGQSPMDDVFEEEEYDEAANEPSLCDETTDNEEEIGTGIQVVDAANEHLQPNFDWSFEDGLGIDQNNSGRTNQSFGLAPFVAAVPEARRTSVVDDIIIEEHSPVDNFRDIEDPRTSTTTKSSDSSDAKTVSAESNPILPSSQLQSVPLTPTSNTVSTFSSPDLSRHQNSYEALRLGTSASSIGDNRTMSSYTTGDVVPEPYFSSEDVPSLTSSRSTMISTMYHTSPRRDTLERPVSMAYTTGHADLMASDRRQKRSSIQSLSKLMGGSFGESRSRLSSQQRPQTAMSPSVHDESKRKKENRLSRLMFWRSKSDSRNSFQSK